ncbi:MAG: hypothetical protein AVDCRST_MAG76-3453, partial [uncultured Acidimicrobiales bacterium]
GTNGQPAQNRGRGRAGRARCPAGRRRGGRPARLGGEDPAPAGARGGRRGGRRRHRRGRGRRAPGAPGAAGPRRRRAAPVAVGPGAEGRGHPRGCPRWPRRAPSRSGRPPEVAVPRRRPRPRARHVLRPVGRCGSSRHRVGGVEGLRPPPAPPWL